MKNKNGHQQLDSLDSMGTNRKTYNLLVVSILQRPSYNNKNTHNHLEVHVPRNLPLRQMENQNLKSMLEAHGDLEVITKTISIFVSAKIAHGVVFTFVM